MRLKELRIKHGLTQKQVAEMIGMSVQKYRTLENGDWGRMKITKIVILAKYYGVSVEHLMGGIDDILKQCQNSATLNK